ncbi:uncharacterized protein TNCT_272901 [Trichonephila clavata]|uniref:Microtubule-associated protein Jupiter n=1 Tax=Trichonephila clavata TaxID=2740835 RepID=A0A8X6I6J3_TRICU|nr:uncharacterized protein TNCT_272901 [Trichonephila clavata]
MTSTEFTVGLDGSRNSSKVLKPPGGGSSDIFGISQNPANERLRNKEAASNTQGRLFGTSNDAVTPVKKNVSSNIFSNAPPAPPKSCKKPYVRRNPITGEEIEMYPENYEKKDTNGKEESDASEQDNSVQENGVAPPAAEEEKKVEAPSKPIQTSIRVRNPPGGKSSGIF